MAPAYCLRASDIGPGANPQTPSNTLELSSEVLQGMGESKNVKDVADLLQQRFPVCNVDQMRGVVGDLAAGGRHPAVNAAKTDSKLSNSSVVARLTRGALPKGGGEIAAPAPFFTKPPGRRARFSRSPSPPGDVSTIHTFDFHGGDAVVMHQSTTDTCVGSARCKDIRSELCIPVQVRSFV